MLETTGRRLRNSARYLLGVGEPELGQSPRQLVGTRDKVKLWRYESDDRRYAPPLLLVMSLVTRPVVFDLQPGNSLVERFCQAGFDVWMIDWDEPGPADSENTLETYCDDYLPWAVRTVVDETCDESVTMFGYCFGGFLSVLSVAANPDMPVENLVVLATPIAPERGPAQLRPGRISLRFDETGNVPAEAMRTAFISLEPVEAEVTKRVNLWQRMDDDQYVTAHRVMTNWGDDHIRFPGATARQLERAFTDGNPIIDGSFRLGGRTVDLGAITIPFLSVIGEKDHIAPPETSEPLMDLVGSADKTELRVPAGHVGLFVGRASAKQCLPPMIEWMAERSRS
ncbi:MAG: alpha/beta fold hydrolase [Ilumatobacter sp.]|nr:alpha/beta fold hydrolase [Ilumatobacter sp.]